MRKIILIFPIFFLACGGGSEEVKVDSDETTLLSEGEFQNGDVDQDYSEDEMDGLGEYALDSKDSLWQIDDYAEFFLESEVALSSESANFDNGTGWYYTVLDKKGGFASVTGAVEGWHEFVIWRMADGYDLVAQMTVGCGPACDYTFKWRSCKGKEVNDIGFDQIFPADEIYNHKEVMHKKALDVYGAEGFSSPEDAALVFNFPQKGTSMIVDLLVGADELQFPIFKLKWDKKRFSIEEEYTDIKVY